MPELAETPSSSGVIYTDIRQDLAAFDSRFGLPPATLRVVNSIAGSRTPYLAGTEEVEDTEMMYAIAPGSRPPARGPPRRPRPLPARSRAYERAPPQPAPPPGSTLPLSRASVAGNRPVWAVSATDVSTM
jgi:hypothetical protein